MPGTYGNIGGEEPSTVSFRVGTVTVNRGSTAEHQEILVLGDPISSLAQARVMDAAPASTDWGVVVRQQGYVAPSTTVTVAAMPANSSQVEIRAITGPVSTAAPASGDTGVIVRQVGYVAPSTTVTVAAMPAGSTSVTVAAITGPVSTAAPGTGDTGVIVRQVGYSTVVTVAAMPANSSQVEVTALPSGSTSVTIAAITGPVSTGAPATGDTGLIVRQVGYSTVVTVAAFPANSSQVEVRAMPANSSVVQVSAFSAGLISSAASADNSSALNVRIVASSKASAVSTSAFATSTQFTIATSTTAAKYVTAYSITSTITGSRQVGFYSGSTLVWAAVLQATSSAITGANLAAGGGDYLFKCDAVSSLTLQTNGSSEAGWVVSVSYYTA